MNTRKDWRKAIGAVVTALATEFNRHLAEDTAQPRSIPQWAPVHPSKRQVRRNRHRAKNWQ